jgi:hypothetical protein
MTDSRQYPLVVMTEAEAATVARFGIGARFEAGTRHMFGHECKIVTDHELDRFAMFVDATDTERIAEALNGGVTQVYVWRDDLAGAVVGPDQPPVGSPAPEQGRSGTGGHPNAHTGAQGVSVVPVPTREQIREAIAVEMEWANGQDWDGLSDHEYLVVGSGHLADAVLALFSPVVRTAELHEVVEKVASFYPEDLWPEPTAADRVAFNEFAKTLGRADASSFHVSGIRHALRLVLLNAESDDDGAVSL